MDKSNNNLSMGDTILQLNRKAMKELNSGNHSQAIKDLNGALLSLNKLPDSLHKSRLLLICYNNLACFYRKTGNQDRALGFLFKAMDLEPDVFSDTLNIVNVHLNICAILSDKKEHERALRHALKAVCILKNKQMNTPMLVLAYHNLGSQYQHLGMEGDAYDCYRLAYTIGSESLGKTHSTVQSVLLSLKTVKKQPVHKRNFSETISHRSNRTQLAIEKAKENTAAIIIQAWWKGTRQRISFLKHVLDEKILKAKMKVQKAREKVNKLERQKRKSIKENYRNKENC